MDKKECYNATVEHKNNVKRVITAVCQELTYRGMVHDDSKLHEPELSGFADRLHLLKDLTYGSEAYKKQCDENKECLEHHYENNSHHPEHHSNGFRGMNLIDLVEMVCDWRAAVERHDDGNFLDSLRINQERFNMSDDICQIIANTVELLDKPFKSEKG